MELRGGRPRLSVVEQQREAQRRNRWAREGKRKLEAAKQPQQELTPQLTTPEQTAPAERKRRSYRRRGPATVFEFHGQAASTLSQFKDITGRRDEAEVLSDAVRVYEWVLRAQTANRDVVSTIEIPAEGGNTLRNYVYDREKAKRYFETKG
jgi:hypothetical protein